MIYLRNVTNQRLGLAFRVGGFAQPGDVIGAAQRRGYRTVDLKPFDRGYIDVGSGNVKAMESQVINQLRAFAVFEEGDVPNELTGVVAALYSTKGEVNVRVAQQAVDHNQYVRTGEGAERRRKAAINVNQSIQNALLDTNQPETGLPSMFEVEIEQTIDSETEDGGRTVEGFRMPEPVARAPRGGGGGRKARAA